VKPFQAAAKSSKWFLKQSHDGVSATIKCQNYFFNRFLQKCAPPSEWRENLSKFGDYGNFYFRYFLRKKTCRKYIPRYLCTYLEQRYVTMTKHKLPKFKMSKNIENVEFIWPPWQSPAGVRCPPQVLATLVG
jgi:hypothetical protein